MSGLAGFRQQYPQYDDIPDDQLADALHSKFYSDIPKDEYLRRLGIARVAAPQEPIRSPDEVTPPAADAQPRGLHAVTVEPVTPAEEQAASRPARNVMTRGGQQLPVNVEGFGADLDTRSSGAMDTMTLRAANPRTPPRDPYAAANARTREIVRRETMPLDEGYRLMREQADRANEIAAADPVRNIRAGVEQIPPMLRSAVGGGMQAVGEHFQIPALADMGENVVWQAQKETEALSRGLKPGIGAQTVNAALQSLAVMLPALALGGPLGGQAGVMTLLGGQAAGMAYGEARQEGLSPGQALVYSGLQSAIEVGTEYLPLKALFTKYPTLRQQFLNFMAREVPTELAATTLQSAVDKASVRPDLTAEEFWNDMLITATSTPLAGGAQVAGVRAAQRAFAPREREPGAQLAEEIQRNVDAAKAVPGAADRAAIEALNPNRAQIRIAGPAPRVTPSDLRRVLDDPRPAAEIAAEESRTAAQGALDTLPPPADPLANQPLPPAIPGGNLPAAPVEGDGTRAAPVRAQTDEQVSAAAQAVDTEPTDGQKAAGNYSKGHIKLHGLDISIENPRGSERSGTDAGGRAWSVTMPAHYGYVKRTEGADGDQVDVYIGDAPQSTRVYIVDQIDPESGEFDEHKAMLGFPTAQAAAAAYNGGFSDGSARRRMGAISVMSLDEFKTWLREGDTKKAIKYKKPAAAPAEPSAPVADDRGMIESGEVLRSASGRTLSPAPKIDTTTDRKLAASIKRLNAWLLDEARKEAEHTGVEFHQTILKTIDPARMSQADQDTVNILLFGRAEGPMSGNRTGGAAQGERAPDPAPTAETGFPSKGTATAAAKRISKETGNAHTVEQREDGRWYPVPSKAQEKNRERLKRLAAERKRLDPRKDSLVTAIVKLGGLDMSERLDIAGDEKAQMSVPFVGYLFTGRGRKIDELASSLGAHGYLSRDELDDVDGGVQALKDKIADELAGRRTHYSDQADDIWEQEIRRQQEIAEDTALAQEIEASDGPIDAADIDFTPEEIDFLPDVDAQTIADQELIARISKEYPDDLERLTMEYESATTAEFMAVLRGFYDGRQTEKDAGARQADRSPQESGGGETVAAPAETWDDPQAEEDPLDRFDLERPTEESLRAQAQAQAEAERQRAEEEAAAERREREAREREEIRQRSASAASTFTLGGDAMDNLTGQGGLFGGTAAAPSTASDGYGDRFSIDLGAMFGVTPYRADKPVQVKPGQSVVSSRILTRKTSLRKDDAEAWGMPRTIYAWRVSVIKNEDGTLYSQVEGMAEDHGRTPDGEVVAYFKPLSSEGHDALGRIAPSVATAAREDWERAQVPDSSGLFAAPEPKAALPAPTGKADEAAESVERPVPAEQDEGATDEQRANFNRQQEIMRKLPANIGKARAEGKLSTAQLAMLDELDRLQEALPQTGQAWSELYDEARGKSDEARAKWRADRVAEGRKLLDETGFHVGQRVYMMARPMLGFGPGVRIEGVVRMSKNGTVSVHTGQGALSLTQNRWKPVDEEGAAPQRSGEGDDGGAAFDAKAAWESMTPSERYAMLDKWAGGQSDMGDRYKDRPWDKFNVGERSTLTAVLKWWKNDAPAAVEADSGTLNKRHSIKRADVLTPAGAIKADAVKGRAPSSIWFYQGDMGELSFVTKARIDGKPDPRAEEAQKLLDRIRAIQAAGWKRANYRAGSYGTVWVFERDDEFLTRAGMENATATPIQRPKLSESKPGYGSMARQQFEFAKAFSEWLDTMPEDMALNRGVVSRKLGETPVGEWARIDDDPNQGVALKYFDDGAVQFRIALFASDWPAMRRLVKEMADRYDKAVDAGDDGIYFVMEEARKAAGSPEPNTETVAPEPAAAPASLVDAHEAVMEAVRNGQATAEKFKASFQSVLNNKPAIEDELSGKTKAQLLDLMGGYKRARYANDKKSEIVKAVYLDMIGEYALGEGISYGMQSGSYEAAVGRLVESTDDEKLTRYANERKAAIEEMKAKIAERAEAIKNPQTLDDFRALMSAHIRNGKTRSEAFRMLTPEQRVRYDELDAESTREAREERKRALKTEVRSAGQTTDGRIIETRHTRDGYDLFVVQLSDRVSREDYMTLLSGAKRLGGWYSKFRGNSAVPGFQFKERASAEAFVKLAGGDVAAATEKIQERRDAFEDDRSQTAVERLNTMADRLEEQADESLALERKSNTARRARYANAAEQAAREQKALAKTMRNIAQAIQDGRAKFLDAVRTKTQVEMLSGDVRTAKHNELREKYPDYGEQMRRRGEPPTAETADHADFPSFTAFRSDLATLARQMLEVEGTKKVGAQLMKVADDVTDAYLEFAREHLVLVSSFTIRRGDEVKAAVFANREEAERAIRNSRLTGRAIVLPVKRGDNRIIMSPSEAIGRNIWKGDGDKRITLKREFGMELVELLGRRAGGKITVPWQFETAARRIKALARIGIETPAEYRSALREFIALREQVQEADRVKLLERAMVGRNNDGLDFFPTSQSVADQMIEAAEITPEMAVLEPSAGMGHIADRIRAAGAEPDVIEMSAERRELLEAKGYHLASGTDGDFLLMEPRKFFTYGDLFRAPDGKEGIMIGVGHHYGRVRLEDEQGNRLGLYNRDEMVGIAHRGVWSGYDRIIMNPPFSNRRDAEHVRHAYTLLKPGGRIVALMGEGVFFGKDKAAQEFRDWLDDVGGTSEKLPEGSFMDPSLPVNTAVNARMVVIDKPITPNLKADASEATPPGDDAGAVDTPSFSRSESSRRRRPQSDTIDVDGKMRPTTNSNGQRIAQTDEALRNFWRWFGDSKVVDEQGRPLVVYHGTDADFNVFSKDKIKSKFPFSIGYHYTTRPSEASIYASDKLGEKMRDGGNVMPVYLRLLNPLIVDTKHPTASMEADLESGPMFDKIGKARRAGKPYDGILIRRERGDKWDGWNVIAFRPEQIKSAIGNAGTFDPANPDIRYSRADEAGDTIPFHVPDRRHQAVADQAARAIASAAGYPTTLRAVQLADAVPGESEGGNADAGAAARDGQSPRRLDFAVAERLAGFFKRKAVLVEVDGYEFNGVSFPEPNSRLNGYFFINVAAQHPYLTVTGHELVHTMKADAPEAYQAFRAAMLPIIRNTAEYRKRRGLGDMPTDKVIDEIMGDVLGDRMMERGFWQEIAGQNLTRFEKIVRYVLTFLSRISGVGRSLGSEQFVADIDAARRAAAQAFMEYGKGYGDVATLALEVLESDQVAFSRPIREQGLQGDIIREFVNTRPLVQHPDYRAAKSGDAGAAIRLVNSLVSAASLEAARQRFGANTIYLPVMAKESTGHNQIPNALAAKYAGATNGILGTGVIQSNEAHHTGARPLERLAVRPVFDGPIQAGARYVVVDDVMTMGGTLAELADHIRAGGGNVVGAVVLTNAARTGDTIAPESRDVQEIERRFGNEVRQQGISPAALTRAEARYLLNFPDADALRASIAKAVAERRDRLAARGIPEPQGVLAGAPPAELEDRGGAYRALPKTLAGAFSRWDKGALTNQDMLAALRDHMESRSRDRASIGVRERVRGVDWVKERLLRARRRGELSETQVDLALWLLDRAPHLANDLAISVREGTEESPSGTYNTLTRLVRIFSSQANDNTAAHEILHHGERMMPQSVQEGIRKEWLAQLERAVAAALKNLDKPETPGWTSVDTNALAPDQAKALLYWMLEAARAGDHGLAYSIWRGFRSGRGLGSLLPYSLSSPSEFWAVNASSLLRQRAEAGTWVQKAEQWLRELIQKARALFGLRSSAPVIVGLNAVMSGNGEFITRSMIANLSEFNDIPQRARQIRQRVADAFDTRRTFNWWHRTVGTQYHKAQVNPNFKAVFDLGQDYLNDVSRYAMMGSEAAPSLLPKLEGFRDAFFNHGASEADRKAIARPIFKGTLQDRVWTDDELRTLFSLTEPQIGYYREYRATIDRSIEELAKSIMVRQSRAVGMNRGLTERMRFADLSFSEFHDRLGAMLRGYAELLRKQAEDIPEESDELNAAADRVMKQFEENVKLFNRTRKLQTEGYAPLMRFGDYSVRIRDDEGGTLYYAMFDTAAEAAEAHRRLSEAYPDYHVSRGVVSKEDYKLYSELSPETVAMFAEIAGVAESELMQEYLRVAVNTRSAMKRLIRRMEIPGFSRDVTRGLASFVLSNARLTATNYHGGDMKEAIENIPKSKGDVRDEATRLWEFLTKPQEEAGAIRGFLFFQFLGGSIASALVNATQPVTMTAPWLAQYATPKRVAQVLATASMEAAKDQPGEDVQAAYQRAVREGVVAPHEIHQLMAETRAAPVSANAVHRITRAWGSFFAIAEAFNRRTTFIAAYRIAKEGRIPDPYEFARRAVYETQGIYNRGNRPNWARGAVGATIFTFKQFSISYLEWLKRLPKKEAALALVILFLAAGLEGQPFAEDIEDLIDAAGQWMGYGTNTRRWLRENLADILGDRAGLFVLRGASAFLPLDVSSRLGLGNLIPGTGALKPSTADKLGDAADAVGPIGSVVESVVKATEKLFRGEPGKAALELAPKAVKDVAKGVEMATTGEYRDGQGRKVTTATAGEAVTKAVGFQPERIAEESRRARDVTQDIRLHRAREDAIADKWARALADADEKGVAQARAELQAWNEKNPKMPIRIERQQIQRRVQALRQDRAQRLGKTAPREIRRDVREALQP